MFDLFNSYDILIIKRTFSKGLEGWELENKSSLFGYVEVGGSSKDPSGLHIINNISYSGKLYTQYQKKDLTKRNILIFEENYYELDLISTFKSSAVDISHYVYGLTLVSKREFIEKELLKWQKSV